MWHLLWYCMFLKGTLNTHLAPRLRRMYQHHIVYMYLRFDTFPCCMQRMSQQPCSLSYHQDMAHIALPLYMQYYQRSYLFLPLTDMLRKRWPRRLWSTCLVGTNRTQSGQISLEIFQERKAYSLGSWTERCFQVGMQCTRKPTRHYIFLAHMENMYRCYLMAHTSQQHMRESMIWSQVKRYSR